MFASLSARFFGIGIIVIAALLSLAGLLVDASRQTRESFGAVSHSAEVIETTIAAFGQLREAESGQRGFVISHDPDDARTFAERVAGASRAMAHVVALTVDNPLQHARAQELAGLVAQRIAVLRPPLDLARRGDFAGAAALISSGHGRDLMDAIVVRRQGFLEEERVLQTNRTEAANAHLTGSLRVALVGAGAVALLVAIGFLLLVRGIQRPLATVMAAMHDLGSGVRGARIDTAMGSREFHQLATDYNAMADRLQLAVADQVESQQQLEIANSELKTNGEILRERGEVIELLGGMAHRMQAARTDEELAAIIRVFVPRVLPDISGVLYAHNNSRNLLVPIAGWGNVEAELDSFAPDQCWALRRGQSHFVTEIGMDIVCGHADSHEIYHCEPLLASGEVIGVLYLRGRIGAERRFRLTVLSENIASALVNHRLQRSLREQTIRDPLTGLFNRRYMEETLALEIARAARSGTPLSLVMGDVDHFKRYNDEFGHDAGDAVLQAVSAEMRSRFRDGDVVCRFGGEEFTIIAPGTAAEAMMERVEAVRQAITELSVRQGGRTLGATSMSFGIAVWAPHMDKEGVALIQAADAALYQAKREGRNRAQISLIAA